MGGLMTCSGSTTGSQHSRSQQWCLVLWFRFKATLHSKTRVDILRTKCTSCSNFSERFARCRNSRTTLPSAEPAPVPVSFLKSFQYARLSSRNVRPGLHVSPTKLTLNWPRSLKPSPLSSDSKLIAHGGENQGVSGPVPLQFP